MQVHHSPSNEIKARQMKTMYIGIYRSRKHTHKKNNTTKNTYTEEHTYIKKIHSNNNKEISPSSVFIKFTREWSSLPGR